MNCYVRHEVAPGVHQDIPHTHEEETKMPCCSSHDNDLIIEKEGLPAVHVAEDGELVVGPTRYSQYRTSGDYRMIAAVHLALAEHQYAQEKAEIEELDRISVDIFAKHWVELDQHKRDAVQSVHDRYERKSA